MVTVAMVVAVIGLILHLMKLTPKINRAGEIAFLCGLLAVLLSPLGAKVLL